MNTIFRIFSISTVATFAAFSAQADEADASQFALKFDGNRTRAEVSAEADTVVKSRGVHPAGSTALAYKSTADRSAVQAVTAEALRKGQIASGEF